MAASSTASSSSVAELTVQDLLADTADSQTARSRWPEAGATKSTFLVNQPLHSTRYHIPKAYTLVNADGRVACDVLPVGYSMTCVYAAAFDAGMRLPLHGLHASVLRHFDLAPSQLLPNAWRYLNAFVLLCEEARVEPLLPVFLFFFRICKDVKSGGRYILKPFCYSLSPPDSGRRCRLFTGKMPQPTWRQGFFFIRGPSWPCSLNWGTPSVASLKKAVLTKDTAEAINKLVHRAGDKGIDIMKFLSMRNPPVGQLQIPPAPACPQHVAVKQEANAAAALTELTRKRKSPEPITSLSPLPLQIRTGDNDRWTESPPAPAAAGVGLGHGEPSVTGDERSCFQKLLQQVKAEFDNKVQELEIFSAQVVLLEEQLAGAKAKHATAMGQLQQANDKASRHAEELKKAKAEAGRYAEELQKAKAEASQYAIELQKAKAEASQYAAELQIKAKAELQKAEQDAYDKGVRDTKKHLVSMISDLPA